MDLFIPHDGSLIRYERIITMLATSSLYKTATCLLVVLYSASLTRAQTTAAADTEQSSAAKIDQLIVDDAESESARPLLSKALDSKSDAIRWRAARAASRLGVSHPEIVTKLQAGVADSNWIVQLHSISALANSGDTSKATIDALAEAALSSNARVAAASISALRTLQAEPNVLAGAISKALTDGNPAAASYALQAIVEAGEKATPLLKELLKQPNSAFLASVAITDIGSDAAGATPELAAFVKSSDQPESTVQALMAVAAIGPVASSAEPAVLAAMQSSDESAIQLTGLYALGSIGAKNATDTLAAGANSSDPFVAMVASWAQAKTNPDDEQLLESAIKQLVAGLASDNPDRARAAAHGLITLEIPAGRAAPYLLQAGKDPVAREHVVAALASLGDQVVPHALRGLSNKDTRPLAIEVIGRLGAQAAGAADDLAACIDPSNPALCVEVNNALAGIGAKAATATGTLADELTYEQARVRQSAMYALREIGPGAAQAKPMLLKHLETATAESTEGRFEQLAAAWTLARVAPDDEAVVNAILPLVEQGLASESELQRAESVAAAADLGMAAKPLKAKLTKLANSDPVASIQVAAADALATME